MHCAEMFFCVALPEATPSPFGTATLLLATLGGQMRSAPRNKYLFILIILPHQRNVGVAQIVKVVQQHRDVAI